MSKQDKLLSRLLGVPADFTWEELVRVLSAYGYREHPGSGSHYRFSNQTTGDVILGLVKPHHPRKHVGRGYLRKIIDQLNLKSTN